MFDVYVLPIHIESGIETPNMPGLCVVSAPRFVNRHRRDEILILFLNTNENPAVSLENVQPLFDSLAGSYFKTSGTVTTAMRGVIRQLNSYLLKSNREKSREGKQTLGIINLAVLHKDQLYVIHSGDTHTVHVTADSQEDLYLPQSSVHGLGIRENPDLSYFQTILQPDSTLVFGNKLPPNLTSPMTGISGRVSIEQIRRKIINQPQTHIRSLVIQFKNGKGEIHFLKPRASATVVESKTTGMLTGTRPELENTPSIHHQNNQPPIVNSPLPDHQTIRDVSDGLGGSYPPPSVSPVWPVSPQGETGNLPSSTGDRFQYEPGPYNNPAGLDQSAAPLNPPPQTVMPPSEIHPEPAKADTLKEWVATTVISGQKTGQQLKQEGSNILKKVLPGTQDQLPQLSPTLMLVIAVAIPVIIAAIAVTIYYQFGPQKEFLVDMQQAEQTASLISATNNPDIQITAMQQTIDWLDQAEKHLINDQSKYLRLQVQDSLDKIFNIKRVTYHPISDNLDGSVKITRILANTSDVYMLDSTQGRVIRLVQNGQQYRLDPSFECSAGQIGISHVGKLVDFAILPANTPNKASVLGIDNSGNLLYCIPDEKPLAKSLTPPDMGWGTIQSVSIDEDGLLYVMVPEDNSVFIYLQQDYTYPDPPRLYFNDQIPTDMGNMIDMAINRNELFLLNSDGHIAHCIFRAMASEQTKCTDVNLFHDSRPGKEGDNMQMSGTHFSRLYLVDVPDPSLFFLDTNSASIFQHSLKLTYYRQLQMQLYPDFSIPTKKISGFSVSPSRVIWTAYGNEVYYGLLP